MRFFTTYLPAILFVATCVVLATWDAPVEYLAKLIGDKTAYSYLVYTLLLIGAVVFMPVTVMPLIPMAAAVLGPFATGVLSVVGWTVGGIIAFLVARYIGRPVLTRFVSLEALDSIVESIPSRLRFVYMVLLRLTLPVDLVSYALGVSKSVPLLEYSLATLIGVTWFSFAFAYLGDALLQGNVSLLLSVGGVSIIIFSAGWVLVKKLRK